VAYDVYLPSREEIEIRKTVIDWVRVNRWDECIVDEVMLYDQPEASVALRLMHALGDAEAYRIIREISCP